MASAPALVLSALSAAAALSAGSLTRRVGTPAAIEASPLQPARLPARLAPPSMQAMGDRPGDVGNFRWGDPNGAGERNAAYRAAQRDLRNRNRQSHPTSATVDPKFTVHGLEAAWVIVFNAGQHDEGLYTHTQQDRGTTSVLAFECTRDAERFGEVLLTKGFEPATPLSWDARRLTSFCRKNGMELSIVPRGSMPTPPSERIYHAGGSDPERMYPGDGTARRDPYMGYRLWLEALFPKVVENCSDDDCIIR